MIRLHRVQRLAAMPAVLLDLAALLLAVLAVETLPQPVLLLAEAAAVLLLAAVLQPLLAVPQLLRTAVHQRATAVADTSA